MTKKILVTGAAGGIGRVLCESLADQYDLIAIDRLPLNEWPEMFNQMSLEKHRLDVTDVNGLAESLPWQSIGVVIHLAATSSLPTCQLDHYKAFETNVLGTIAIADLARKNNTTLVNASSSAVYEGSSKPYSEDASISTHLCYPMTKAHAEDYLKSLWVSYGYPSSSLRFFNVFGPFQDFKRQSPPLLNYLVREALDGRQPILHSNGFQKRDYISVHKVVEAIRVFIDTPSQQFSIYNVTSGVQFSVRDIVRLVEEELEVELNAIYRDSDLLWDSYSALWDSSYPLKRSIVKAETEKNSAGPNTNLTKDTKWRGEYDTEMSMREVIRETKRYIESFEEPSL